MEVRRINPQEQMVLPNLILVLPNTLEEWVLLRMIAYYHRSFLITPYYNMIVPLLRKGAPRIRAILSLMISFLKYPTNQNS